MKYKDIAVRIQAFAWEDEANYINIQVFPQNWNVIAKINLIFETELCDVLRLKNIMKNVN